MHELGDAQEKVRWAKKHFEILRGQIEAFEQRDTHTFRVEIDPQTGKYEFYVSGLQVCDPDWGLMIGDILHNARTALDYVLVRLWARITGQPPEDIKIMSFPIYNDPKTFRDRAYGPLSKEPAFSGYLARIEELQPFNAFNASIWGDWGTYRQGLDPSLPFALDRLSTLDNIDKHRVPYVTWLGVQFGAFLVPRRDAPADFKPLGGGTTADPLEDGTKVGEYTFQVPLPSEWQPTQMQMKGYFPLKVSFPDPSPIKSVLEILPWCISGAEAVIAIFLPVFEQGAPPLPVTAVKTIRG